MDMVKDVNGVSTCTYRNYTGVKIKIEFHCLTCKSTIVFRHKKQYSHSFWEGYFICRGCKKEVNYYSDDWNKTEIHEPNQLSLF